MTTAVVALLLLASVAWLKYVGSLHASFAAGFTSALAIMGVTLCSAYLLVIIIDWIS